MSQLSHNPSPFVSPEEVSFSRHIPHTLEDIFCRLPGGRPRPAVVGCIRLLCRRFFGGGKIGGARSSCSVVVGELARVTLNDPLKYISYG
jgi:hypothetical protein